MCLTTAGLGLVGTLVLFVSQLVQGSTASDVNIQVQCRDDIFESLAQYANITMASTRLPVSYPTGQTNAAPTSAYLLDQFIFMAPTSMTTSASTTFQPHSITCIFSGMQQEVPSSYCESKVMHMPNNQLTLHNTSFPRLADQMPTAEPTAGDAMPYITASCAPT